MHRGGIADKVGNRYEARWIVYQLLGLLDGAISSITIEALGKENEGFEFLLVRSGTKEWHQCKRQTAQGSWSINLLTAAGVLSAFAGKLASDAGRCVFVSTDPAPQLKRLKEKVPAASTLAAFEPSLSDSETQSWSVLRERLGGSPSDAFDFLGRTEFRTISEDDLREVLRGRLSFWFKDDPETVEALFRAWVEDDANFNRPLTYDHVIEFASDKKLSLKHYELDDAMPGRIRDATKSYTNSYPRLGAGLFQIDRPGVGEIQAALEMGAGVVLVTGAAGTGKSAILAHVIERLRGAKTLHLAFRVDQAGEVASIDQLGSHVLGIADNPVVILEQLAGQGRAVFLIDQADAVSEVSGRLATLRKVILDLIAKATQYPRVQIVFSCRTFDLENDHAFREIAHRLDAVRVDIKLFERAEVEPVLTRLGILYDPGNAKLMSLLRLPIGLSLAAELTRSGIADLRSVEHISELYQSLLDARNREIQRDHRPAWNIYEPLGAMAASMSDRQQLSCPAMVLDAYGGATDILQRAGLVVASGRELGFAHESLFDFIHARFFVSQKKELVAFLLGAEQTLFRRTQVRQILSFERDLDRVRYLTDVEAVLLDAKVRPHIRDAVLRWLATLADPTPQEWRLIERYAACDGLPRKSGLVIYDRKPWFDLLLQLDVINSWLQADDNDLQWVFGFLRSVAPMAPAEVATIFNDFLKRRPDCVRAVFGALRWLDPKADSAPIADCLISALDQSPTQEWEADSEWDEYYPSWIKAAPGDAARILSAQFTRWYRLNLEGHPFERTHPGGSAIHWMAELGKAAPSSFLAAILPAMHETMKRTAESDERPAEDQVWYWRNADKTDLNTPGLLDIVRTALADAAAVNPGATADLLSSIEPRRFMTSLHLLLETIAAHPTAFHPMLIRELDNPGLFQAGWHMAPTFSAGKAIAASFPFLSADEASRAERAVLELAPEIKLASRALKKEKDWQERFPNYPSWCLKDSGKRQWSVLRQIGPSQLSPAGQKRLAELDRKFVGHEPEEPDGIRGGMVGSPIAPEHTAHMNDAALLGAIKEYSNRGERIWDRDGLRGGASELGRALGARARADPERFIALLARLPEGARPSFAEGIISGIAETKPDPGRVERILKITSEHEPSNPSARTLVWLIRSREGNLGALSEAKLVELALTSDDSTGIVSISHGNKREKEPDWKQAFELGGDLGSKAINSARGSALEELGHIAWKNREAYERYSHVIKAVAGSNAQPHIHAALGVLLLASLKHDPQVGIHWVAATAGACPAALFSREGHRAVSWAGDLDANAFATIIGHFLSNGDPGSAAFAALCVFERCLEDPAFLKLGEKLIEVSEEYRAAAAAVAAANLSVNVALCSDWLIRFFNDESKMVRIEAADCFRLMKGDRLDEHAAIFEAYVASPYFSSDRTYFLHRLENAPPAMANFVLKLLEDVLQTVHQNGTQGSGHDLFEVSDIVLKIYASNLDDPVRVGSSLDLIDRLIDTGLMHGRLEAAA